MGLAANLPADLWPEVWGAAAYLYNRTPRLRNAWRTPLETLFRWFSDNTLEFPLENMDPRPDWAGMYAYGYRAYPLQKDYLIGSTRLWYKTYTRAYIRYLVRYKALNIYRI